MWDDHIEQDRTGLSKDEFIELRAFQAREMQEYRHARAIADLKDYRAREKNRQ